MAITSAASAETTRDLYERHGANVFAFTLSRLGDRHDAEDATQATFLNAFRGLQRGVVPRAELTWLLKIAERVVGNRRRTLSRRSRIETPIELEVAAERIGRPLSETEVLFRLEDALAALPSQQRRAVLLREWHGLTYHEISEELGISHAAVETLLFRARRVLAANLTDPDAVRRGGRMRRRLDVGCVLSAAKGVLPAGSSKLAALGGAAAAGAIGVTASTGPADRAMLSRPTPTPAALAALPTVVTTLQPGAPAGRRAVTPAGDAPARTWRLSGALPIPHIADGDSTATQSPDTTLGPSEEAAATTVAHQTGAAVGHEAPPPVHANDAGTAPAAESEPLAQTPPGQDPDRVPPGLDASRTPPGQDPDRTPPGQDEAFASPGQAADAAPPGQAKKEDDSSAAGGNGNGGAKGNGLADGVGPPPPATATGSERDSEKKGDSST